MLYYTPKGGFMQATLNQLEEKIESIKRELTQIGSMRPGSLTCQYRVPRQKIGPFWQLSYTHHMKSRTEYARPQFITQLKKQIATYKRFKKLTEEWVDLAIEHSKLQIKLAIKQCRKVS
jgi:hypothetical protein